MRVHTNVAELDERDDEAPPAWHDRELDNRLGDLGLDVRQRIYQGLWDICIVGNFATDLGEVAGRGWLWREHTGFRCDDGFAVMVHRLALGTLTAAEERSVLTAVEKQFAQMQNKIELRAASADEASGRYDIPMNTDLICGSRITLVMAALTRIGH